MDSRNQDLRVLNTERIDRRAMLLVNAGALEPAEYDAAGTRTKRYTYLEGDNAPIQLQDANGTYYVHSDRLRTPRWITSSAASVVWRALRSLWPCNGRKRNASALSESLNKVKKLGATRDGLQLLEKVWAGDQSQYPEFAWETIADSGVRLNGADLLVQAAKNGDITSEPADVHDFVRNTLDTGSPNLVGQAAITLSIFDRDEDVPALERIATQRDPRTFRSIILALSRMCAPAADAALTRVGQEASASDKEFIKETRARMSDFKQQPGVCQH